MNVTKARQMMLDSGYRPGRAALELMGIELTHETCVDCGKEKTLDKFPKQRTNISGHATVCWPCEADRRILKQAQQGSLFTDDEAPEIDTYSDMVDFNMREWGCNTPQFIEYTNAAWAEAMGNRRFDEPGMEIKERVARQPHMRLA